MPESTKIRKVRQDGTSAVVSLAPEHLEALGVEVGDYVAITEKENAIEISQPKSFTREEPPCQSSASAD